MDRPVILSISPSKNRIFLLPADHTKNCKMKKKHLLLLALLTCNINLYSAVVVTVTNPTSTTPNLAASYPSLLNAIAALNTITAISGPVTLTCGNGTETAPAGGFSISFTAATTFANDID